MYTGILALLTFSCLMVVMGTGTQYVFVVLSKINSPKPNHDKKLMHIVGRFEYSIYALLIVGIPLYHLI